MPSSRPGYGGEGIRPGSALLATFLHAVGEAAVVPLIPAVAAGYGASAAVAGLVAAMLMLGALVADLPSGAVVGAIGERTAMAAAAALTAGGAALALLVHTLAGLIGGLVLVGVATALFGLGRHMFVTCQVPYASRGRVSSSLGGIYRLGYVAGPLAGALLIQWTSRPHAAFVLQIVVSALALVVLAPWRRSRSRSATGSSGVALLSPVHAVRRAISVVAAGAAIFSGLRASRQVALPLTATFLGMSEARLSGLIGLAGILDFSLFYLGGRLLDRTGRVPIAVGATLGLAVGHGLLVLATMGGHPTVAIIAATGTMAAASGIASGMLMTLGADLAPSASPAAFLGSWRFLNDLGAVSAPLVFSASVSILGLAPALALVAASGGAGAAILFRSVPRREPP